MKEIEEYTAEVLARSEKRIKERKRNKKRIIMTCIPLVICITVFSIGILPSMMPEKSANYSAETTEDATTETTDEIYDFGGDKQETSNSETVSGGILNGSPALKVETASKESKGNSNDICDRLVTIIYNGKTYVQIYKYNVEEKISALQIDKYLGNAKSFDGFYNNEKDVDGKVYSVKDNSDLLIIHLHNGGKILLRMTDE